MNSDQLGAIATPDGRKARFIVDVQLGALTPHYVYAASAKEAGRLASGDTSGVWEFSLGVTPELVPVPEERYSGQRGGFIRIHPLLNAPTAHRRVLDSQECVTGECEYTEELAGLV